MNRTYQVSLEELSQRQFRKLPMHIKMAFRTWTILVEEEGITAMRKIPGYHDEPLRGDRQGQRSSRLSRSYRIIYREDEKGLLTFIIVLEVNKHDY